MTKQQKGEGEAFLNEKRNLNLFGMTDIEYNIETGEETTLEYPMFDEIMYDDEMYLLQDELDNRAYPITFEVIEPTTTYYGKGGTGTKTFEDAESIFDMLKKTYARNVAPGIENGTIYLPTHDMGGGIILTTELRIKGAKHD